MRTSLHLHSKVWGQNHCHDFCGVESVHGTCFTRRNKWKTELTGHTSTGRLPGRCSWLRPPTEHYPSQNVAFLCCILTADFLARHWAEGRKSLLTRGWIIHFREDSFVSELSRSVQIIWTRNEKQRAFGGNKRLIPCSGLANFLLCVSFSFKRFCFLFFVILSHRSVFIRRLHCFSGSNIFSERFGRVSEYAYMFNFGTVTQPKTC